MSTHSDHPLAVRPAVGFHMVSGTAQHQYVRPLNNSSGRYCFPTW